MSVASPTCHKHRCIHKNKEMHTDEMGKRMHKRERYICVCLCRLVSWHGHRHTYRCGIDAYAYSYTKKIKNKKKKKRHTYMIAMTRSIFLGSTRADLWCLKRPSGTSSALDPSLRGGAVTGRVGNALDQKGSSALRNLWRSGPTTTNYKYNTRKHEYAIRARNKLWVLRNIILFKFSIKNTLRQHLRWMQ